MPALSNPDDEEYTVDGIFLHGYIVGVDLIQIYQCFCDETRLRILNLLRNGPLCVCHLQDLLAQPQVKISKHLAYLKEKGIVHAQRHQNWMIYSLPQNPPPELEANLQCLQDCVQTHPVFKTDMKNLKALRPKVGWLAELSTCAELPELCCSKEQPKKQSKTRKSTHLA